MEPQAPARPSSFGVSFERRTVQRIGRVVCVLAGCAFLVAATVIVLDLVRTRAVPDIDWLLFAGVPILIVGQLWAMWAIGTRMSPRPKGSWKQSFRRRSGVSTADFFGDLPPKVRVAVIAVTSLIAVSAFTATPVFSGINGGPAAPTPHCRYPLANHGTTVCTDEATYDKAGRYIQRFAASCLAGFFVLHLGVAAGTLAWRRRED